MEPVQLRLQSTPGSAREARNFLFAWSEILDPDSLDEVRTVVSEFVALGVKHGGANPIDLKLELADAHVKGMVLDGVAQTLSKAADEASFALKIIDGLVDEWSTDPERGAVWFRMPIQRLKAR
jgi:hypothetical protein